MRPGPYNHRIQAQRHQVAGVRWQLALPQAFGHDTKHASAIEMVNAVGDGGKFEVAKGNALHGHVASLKAYHRPRRGRACPERSRRMPSAAQAHRYSRIERLALIFG